jgi:hypothetical protein
VDAAHVGRAPAHEVGVGFRRVGEAVVLDRQQLGGHECVEQRLELVGADTQRSCQRWCGHGPVLERGEHVELHAGQHRYRRVDGEGVAKDRRRVDLGWVLPVCHVDVSFGDGLKTGRSYPR